MREWKLSNMVCAKGYDGTGEVIIRRMTKEDAKAVAEIERQCFADPWSENAFCNAATDKNYIYMVAEQDGQILGMAGCILTIDEGDLTNVAVSEAYRGKGIARKVVSTLMEEATSLGIVAFTLEVREHNTRAIGLYESLGFKFEGKRPGFYSNPTEDALIYWKRD